MEKSNIISLYSIMEKLKSAFVIQDLYRSNMEFINFYNREIRFIYQMILCAMINIQENYDNKITKKEKYNEQMENIDDLLTEYNKIPKKISLKTFKTLNKYDLKISLFELRKTLKTVCKESGSTKVSNLIRVFIEDDLEISETYKNLIDFYDSMFTTLSCNHIVKKIEAIEECLPFAKKSDNNDAVTLTEKIDGADIYFTYKNNLIVITGYFKKDPLNISRNGGTLEIKYKSILAKSKNLSIPKRFKKGFVSQLSLRDFIVYNEDELVQLISNSYKELNKYKKKQLSELVKEFMHATNDKQRKILTLFLLSDSEDQFLAHIIYDMICNTSEMLKPQPLAEEIYKSLHWTVQKIFRIVFKNVESRIAELSALTEDDIPYEKRIGLLKADDSVKIKAMDKLKEIKGTKESSAKAQQYLDGLLKIPFGVLKKEPVMTFLKEFGNRLGQRIETMKDTLSKCDGKTHTKTRLETALENYNRHSFGTANSIDNFWVDVEEALKDIKDFYESDKKFSPNSSMSSMDDDELLSPVITEETEEMMDVNNQCLDSIQQINKISKFLEQNAEDTEDGDNDLLQKVSYEINRLEHNIKNKMSSINLKDIVVNTDCEENCVIEIENDLLELMKEWLMYKKNKKEYLQNVRLVLDKSVYGHSESKLQLERLISQWMNGKMKGTVFGFQGPPGTGKTTLAKKGLSRCLVDDEGNPRPFAFVPLGGSTNGAILEGHSYTYMGSTWGKIVDILMETKCMNPIIYIDEVDKISNTEHGREIIGILTHLTDPSQNTEISDRYFAGIKFDISNCLIIFSYNNTSAIDRILRDRITEINIKPLTMDEKIQIVKDYSLPDILDTVGYSKGDIYMEDDVIKYLVSTYTNEAGVRKINEKLTEIVRDINHVNNISESYKFPYKVTKEHIETLFTDEPKVHIRKIASKPGIGVVNGLYATSTGLGGITIIQVVKTPSEKKLGLELTGKQGDVMKESMICAKTLAWNLLPKAIKKRLNEEIEIFGNFGLHIHCPEASTPKDGPSAGCAITSAILSILCGVAIRNNVAMTGEIDLHGNVHPIGGLESKLLGAVDAGVDTALVPKENEDDYNKIVKDHPDLELKVHIVSNIFEVIQYAFVENELEFIPIHKY